MNTKVATKKSLATKRRVTVNRYWSQAQGLLANRNVGKLLREQKKLRKELH